jgi:putative flippase GtrA
MLTATSFRTRLLGPALRAFCALPQFLQFAVAGGLGTVVNVVLLWTLVGQLGVPKQPAYGVTATTTLALLWAFNRHLTWRDHRGPRGRTAAWFVAARISSLTIGWGTFWLLLHHHLSLPIGGQVRLHYQAANLVSIGVGTVLNFVNCRYVVFAQPGEYQKAVGVVRSAVLRGLIVASLAYPAGVGLVYVASHAHGVPLPV